MSESCKLYVGGLSFQTTDEELNKYFAGVGEIKEAYVVYDKETPDKSRGTNIKMFMIVYSLPYLLLITLSDFNPNYKKGPGSSQTFP